MHKKMTPKEFLTKCFLEGGFVRGLSYGLKDEDIDDAYQKFKELVKQASQFAEKLQILERELIEVGEIEDPDEDYYYEEEEEEDNENE